MASHSYSSLPSPKRFRSRFRDDWDVITSMSVGKLYPIYWEEVVPGDTFQEDLSFVSRLTSAYLRPVMDDLYLDLYAFFVPNRILYDDYEAVFGNPKPSAYSDNDLAEVPSLAAGTVSSKTVADYIGLPVGSVPEGISVLPFRAFAKIWNQYFRNENTTDETFVQDGELGSTEVFNNQPWSATNYMGQLPYVGKIKDYFTSAVPQPQKGAPVSLGLGTLPQIPVITTNSGRIDGRNLPSLTWSITSPADPSSTGFNLLGLSRIGSSGNSYETQVDGTTTSSDPSPFLGAVPTNLVTSGGGSLGAVNVDQLRLATQRQLMLVQDTLYGSRFREWIFASFGVHISDKTVQIPQFLSGKRIPLNTQQVAQTSASTEQSPLAALGGYSLTSGSRQARYRHFFEEYGMVFWCACIRYKHTYQQGIPKKFGRKVRDDYYHPLFSHIGYQPIYTSEIYASGQTSLKGNIFGYTEAWIEYKHSFSQVSGEARSDATNSLDIYHFADLYSSAPVIGAQFNQETPDYVDRTLAVPSTSQDQFILDFHCRSTKVRVMPVYCEPGYMDHWFK